MRRSLIQAWYNGWKARKVARHKAAIVVAAAAVEHLIGRLWEATVDLPLAAAQYGLAAALRGAFQQIDALILKHAGAAKEAKRREQLVAKAKAQEAAKTPAGKRPLSPRSRRAALKAMRPMTVLVKGALGVVFCPAEGASSKWVKGDLQVGSAHGVSYCVSFLPLAGASRARVQLRV